MLPDEERRARFDAAWEEGHLLSLGSRYTDLITNRAASDTIAALFHERIRTDREGPGHRRCAVPHRPRHRHQADVPRQRLLRDVQPAARAPGRPAQAADHDGHGEGDRHDRGVVRVRRHRLRHRLRRHDRGHRRRRHHRSRRRVAEAEVGRRPGHVPRPDDRRVPEPVHDHRAREPVGAVEHGGVDRAARSTGSPTAWPGCATTASTPSSRPRRPRPGGSSTSTTAPTSPCSRRPTPGTWAPTCPASRGCSCPTSAASTATGRRATRSSSAACTASG